MLLIYGNEELWESFAEDDLAQLIQQTDALQVELRETGEFVGAYGVADQTQAKTVRSQDGVPAVTDGPYIEAKEYLGSFDIIDCDSLERALEIAARVPFARYGSVEVRPLMSEAAPEG
ncbi:MAG: YciI family protein [Acidimicrobiales bacterium]|nr:YciI family protein [Acidimicrobiales bacterium]